MAKLSEKHRAHWDRIFESRSWGKYPAEDIVRFASRMFDPAQRKNISVLDLGSGPGANTWFLCREGFKVSAIDHSQVAIEQLLERIKTEAPGKGELVDAIASDFSMMPFEDGKFDLVVDHVSICANTIDTIRDTIREIHRVLKAGGYVYSKFISVPTTGVTEGQQVEPSTFVENPRGPTVGIGPLHVVDEDRLRDLFSNFNIVSVDKYFRTDGIAKYQVEELALVGRKSQIS